MGMCQDPALTYLNDQGYNVVRLPRAGIEPMDVLGRDGASMERLGQLGEIWASTLPVPATHENTSSGIVGTKTRDLKLSIGLKILEGILSGLGASVPQVNGAYQRATKVQFSFPNPMVIGVDPFAVGNFLGGGDLAANNPFVNRYFHDEGPEAFIITEVLKADALTVTATDDKGTSIGVDLPQIQQTVGAKLDVSTSAASSAAVTYKGQTPITFGFKAFAIGYADGNWKVLGAAPSAGLAFSVGQTTPRPVLFTRGGRVSLRETT